MEPIPFRLTSFVTCPFVQRAAIVLVEKGAAFEWRPIDLRNPPSWFGTLSPRGKVPVLETSEGVLFESLAICEFIDETLPGSGRLMPQTPFLRAQDRAWAAVFAEDVFGPFYHLSMATTEDQAAQRQGSMQPVLALLEDKLSGRDYFSGDGSRYGMADVCGAPFAMKALDARNRGWFDLLTRYPRLAAWATRIEARPSTRRGVPPDYAKAEEAGLQERGVIWLQRSPSEGHTHSPKALGRG